MLKLYRLRWQDDQGVPREESLLPVFVPEDSGLAMPNPGFFHELLTTPLALRDSDALHPELPGRIRAVLDSCAEAELAARCTERRYPNAFISLAVAKIV